MAATPAAADEVLFLNGDRLTGRIVKAAGGKLVLRTEAAGDITIDLKTVKTFSTDEPVQLKVHESTVLKSPVTAIPEGGVAAAPTPKAAPQPLALEDITAINPPGPVWTGSFALNGLFITGNTETQQIGFSGWLKKRWEDDRLSLGTQYHYGREKDPDSGDEVTSVDYGLLYGKYDHFLNKKPYALGQLKAERDGVARLDLRLTPSVGLGYQGFEGPTFNLSTEAGLAWVYERFESTGTREYFAPRLAYSVDWTPVTILKLYHTLEYLPRFDDAQDYLLNIEAGLRTTVWKGFFSEFKIEFRYDGEPAPGRRRADTRYIVGVGWQF